MKNFLSHSSVKVETDRTFDKHEIIAYETE